MSNAVVVKNKGIRFQTTFTHHEFGNKLALVKGQIKAPGKILTLCARYLETDPVSQESDVYVFGIAVKCRADAYSRKEGNRRAYVRTESTDPDEAQFRFTLPAELVHSLWRGPQDMLYRTLGSSAPEDSTLLKRIKAALNRKKAKPSAEMAHAIILDYLLDSDNHTRDDMERVARAMMEPWWPTPADIKAE